MRLNTHEKKLNDLLRNQKINQVKNTNKVTEMKDNQTQPKQYCPFRDHLPNPETFLFDRASSVE